MKFNFKQFREDFNLLLFNTPGISFEDMKIINTFILMLEKKLVRFNINGTKN